MPWVERLEKVGRLVLWLSIASACVIVPVAYTRQLKAEAEAKVAARKLDEDVRKADAEKLEKAAHEPRRLSIASMGSYMSALTPGVIGDQGRLWLTNVSPASGVLCVTGVANNRATHRTTSSLPACTPIAAYASAVHISLMFAGGELSELCPKQGDCDISFRDSPEGKDPGAKVAAAGWTSPP